MQLSEADRLSFAFLTEIKQISRKSHLLCDFFVSFFSKKNERENLYQLRISDNTLLYKCMHYAVQLRNEGKSTISKEIRLPILKQLTNKKVPAIYLTATNGDIIDLSKLDKTVIFIVPRPSIPLYSTPKNWDTIPDAKGCTLQSKNYKDSIEEFTRLGYTIYGLSVQSIQYLQEVQNRLELPFKFLSDKKLELATILNLPTMQIENLTLLTEVTHYIHYLIAQEGA